MEYKPALPTHNDNVSHNRPFREFLLLLSAVAVVFVGSYFALGSLVDVAVEHIDPEREAILFAALPIPSEMHLAPADGREQAVQDLVDQLRDCFQITSPLKVHLVETNMVNAMAFPGGRILVFNGLLDNVQSENGLAFVLAHELAHFQHRDHLRGMGRGIVMAALMTAIAGPDSSLTRLVTPMSTISQATYSQQREQAADLKALAAVVCHYGHAGGSTELFTTLEGKEFNLIPFFASHPAAAHRLSILEQQIQQQHYPMQEVRPLPRSLSSAD